MSEIEPDKGTKTYIFQKSASTTLWCFTGYHFNAHKSRHCSGSTPFQTFSEKPCTGTVTPIDLLENKAFQQNWPRQAILGARFRTRFPTSRWSAALMTVVCTAQTPSKNTFFKKGLKQVTYTDLFEGVWALHTTVIRAADQREVGNLVRKPRSKTA